jgi:fructosamine-3-kinase
MPSLDGSHPTGTPLIQPPRPLLDTIERLLTGVKGHTIRIELVNDVPAGSSFHTIRKLFTNEGVFCLKYRPRTDHLYFSAESDGINRLQQTNTVLTPKVVLEGVAEGYQYLMTEFIFSAPKRTDYWETLGRQLAELHRHTASYFGLESDNFIGSLPQRNRKHDRWTDFFISERLIPQLEYGIQNQVFDKSLASTLERLFPRLSDFFPEEPPALLHGDLWSGNLLTNEAGHPVVIDPAVYYGHREAELAFTQLFGGFSTTFLQAYQTVFPLTNGFFDRMKLYNLYPLMVHANLFGGHYVRDVVETVRRLG